MMDAVVEYRNDQPDEQENDRLGHLFCELRGLREDLRFLRMLSISQGRRIDDIMEQFEPKPSDPKSRIQFCVSKTRKLQRFSPHPDIERAFPRNVVSS